MPSDVAFVVREASGTSITDHDGKRYVDYVLGSGALVLGHLHPDVNEAMLRQLQAGTHYYTMNEPAIRLAEVLVEAIPCAEQIKFTSTGAEATFQALRLARAATGRKNILRFRGSYHGHHDYGVAAQFSGIPSAVTDTVITGEFNDEAGTRELVERHHDDLAAIIVEPFQRAIPPAPGFLAALREMATDHGIVLIFDEVVTGFRLGWGGAQARYGVTPDLGCYGKIIGGGLPLGAVAGRRDILHLSDPGNASSNAIFFSSTLNGNPLAAAAGLATLDVIRRTDAYANLEQRGDQLRAALRDAAAASPKPIMITGDGALVGVTVGSGDPHSALVHRNADAAARKQLETEMIRAGAFVNLGARMYLSTVHSSADITAAADALRRAVQALS
ncbi:MAG: aspartate aminotransferase family protein [Actinomycetota bacterium]